MRTPRPTPEVTPPAEADGKASAAGKRTPRQGWADASRGLALAGDDALVWPEFANEDDAALKW